MQALGTADPVALHQPHLVGPAMLQRVEAGEQLLGGVGNAEEPLRQLAALDQRARAPAAPVDHLLIGEHGVVDRVPIDFALAPIGEAALQEVEEDALLLAIIGGIAGGDLARPVKRQAQQLQLLAHRRDVLVGPDAGMRVALDGGVLGRQAEGVPAHGMQDVEALHALEARDHVAHDIIAPMADMDAPGRVGEHLEHVIFGARVVIAGAVDTPFVPDLLPAGLGLAGIVALGAHRFVSGRMSYWRASSRHLVP